MILISISLILTGFKGIYWKRILQLNLKEILYVNSFDSEAKGRVCEGKESSYNKENKKHDEEKEKNREIFFIFTFVNFVANFLIVSLIANVQIINRVATSNPILFIFCSEFIKKYKKENDKFGKSIAIVFISYSIIGCIMHCASYGYA